MNGPTTLHVKNSNIILMLHVELEKARYNLYAPILTKFGRLKQASPYDLTQYAALDPLSRCFDNAMEAAQQYSLAYIEGVVLFLADHPERPEGQVVTMAHAWCENRQGAIVDPTISKNQHHQYLSYLGVPIRKEYSLQWQERVGYFGCLDGDRKGRRIGVHYDPISRWLDLTANSAINCSDIGASALMGAV